MRSATVRCLGVFISKVPFSSLESCLSFILRDKETAVDQRSHSESRLKLVTLSILKLNYEIERDARIGIFSGGTSYQMTITGVARVVVMDMFDASLVSSRCGKNTPPEIVYNSQQHSEKAISGALDLIAATSLILCPPVLQKNSSLRDFVGSLVRNFSLKKSLLPDFIEAVLKDENGIIRIGQTMQQEIHKRATDRCMLSLNSDSNLSSIADALLIVDNDKINVVLPPALPRQSSLSLSIPAYEPIDSLATTAETILSRSNGSMLSSNGVETSPLRYFSPSNLNTPVSQYSDSYEGSYTGDGTDADLDRTKLSALKKSQSRGGSRRQNRIGSQGTGYGTSMNNTTDFFGGTNGDLLEGEDSNSRSDSRSPMGGRSKTFFSSPSVGVHKGTHTHKGSAHDVNMNGIGNGNGNDRSSARKLHGDNDEFSAVSVVTNHTASFIRPNRRHIHTLMEGDGVVSDVDADADEFDDEIERHISMDAEYEDEIYSMRDRDTHGGPDLLALAGESFLQGLGARTAEERTRGHQKRYHHNSGRSNPQTPLAVGTYGPDGQRTQGLVIQGHNPERAGKRSIAVATSLARESRLLAASPSLPVLSPDLSVDYMDSDSTYGLPVVYNSDPRVLDFSSIKQSQSNRDSHNHRDRDHSLTSNSLDPMGMGMGSTGSKIRILRSPRSGVSSVSGGSNASASTGVSAVPSSSSSRCSSPRGTGIILGVSGSGNKNTITGYGSGSGSKIDNRDKDNHNHKDNYKDKDKSRGRVRLSKEQEDDLQGQEYSSDQDLGSGLREYQLAGVSTQHVQ